MSVTFYPHPPVVYKEFNTSLARAAGTYPICTSSGETLIHAVYYRITVAGAGFGTWKVQSTDVDIQTLLTGKGPAACYIGAIFVSYKDPFILGSGKTIASVFTGAGVGTAGNCRLVIGYTRLNNDLL